MPERHPPGGYPPGRHPNDTPYRLAPTPTAGYRRHPAGPDDPRFADDSPAAAEPDGFSPRYGPDADPRPRQPGQPTPPAPTENAAIHPAGSPPPPRRPAPQPAASHLAAPRAPIPRGPSPVRQPTGQPSTRPSTRPPAQTPTAGTTASSTTASGRPEKLALPYIYRDGDTANTARPGLAGDGPVPVTLQAEDGRLRLNPAAVALARQAIRTGTPPPNPFPRGTPAAIHTDWSWQALSQAILKDGPLNGVAQTIADAARKQGIDLSPDHAPPGRQRPTAPNPDPTGWPNPDTQPGPGIAQPAGDDGPHGDAGDDGPADGTGDGTGDRPPARFDATTTHPAPGGEAPPPGPTGLTPGPNPADAGGTVRTDRRLPANRWKANPYGDAERRRALQDGIEALGGLSYDDAMAWMDTHLADRPDFRQHLENQLKNDLKISPEFRHEFYHIRSKLKTIANEIGNDFELDTTRRRERELFGDLEERTDIRVAPLPPDPDPATDPAPDSTPNPVDDPTAQQRYWMQAPVDGADGAGGFVGVELPRDLAQRVARDPATAAHGLRGLAALEYYAGDPDGLQAWLETHFRQPRAGRGRPRPRQRDGVPLTPAGRAIRAAAAQLETARLGFEMAAAFGDPEAMADARAIRDMAMQTLGPVLFPRSYRNEELAQFAMEWAPVLGAITATGEVVESAADAGEALADGRYGDAAYHTSMGVLAAAGVIPGIGTAASKAGRATLKLARKSDTLGRAIGRVIDRPKLRKWLETAQADMPRTTLADMFGERLVARLTPGQIKRLQLKRAVMLGRIGEKTAVDTVRRAGFTPVPRTIESNKVKKDRKNRESQKSQEGQKSKTGQETLEQIVRLEDGYQPGPRHNDIRKPDMLTLQDIETVGRSLRPAPAKQDGTLWEVRTAGGRTSPEADRKDDHLREHGGRIDEKKKTFDKVVKLVIPVRDLDPDHVRQVARHAVRGIVGGNNPNRISPALETELYNNVIAWHARVRRNPNILVADLVIAAGLFATNRIVRDSQEIPDTQEE